jgi:Sigma-70 region 2
VPQTVLREGFQLGGVSADMSPRTSDLFLRAQSDERLVNLSRAGHDRAFAVIVNRYRRELLAFARRQTSDGRAEDIVQQSLLNAFAALHTGKEVKHLRGWLYQIVRNTARGATDGLAGSSQTSTSG